MKVIYLSKKSTRSRIRQKLLLRYLKKKSKECNCIVLGRELKKDINFVNKINDIEIPICNGRWLFKFLVIQILEYISKCQNRSIDKLKIVLMTNENTELISYYIEELTKITNKVKIITGHRERFYYIEQQLYYNNGIVLEISNNKRKGLQDIDVIFNFDFDEDKINKYKINENAIIINFKEKISIKDKSFNGININYYEIDFTNKTMDMLDWIKEFEKEEIYESYLYRNDKIYVIEQDIIKDKIVIKSLIGNNGKISKKEYYNILDKTSYLS